MNLPSFNCEMAVVMNSWKSPELLRVSIPALKKSSVLDTKIFVCLNQADKESIDYLYSEGVEFIALNTNYGTISIDCLLGLFKSRLVCWQNDDMIMSRAWDKEMSDIIDRFSPCAAQVTGIERGQVDGRGVVLNDPSLPDFFDSNIYGEFNSRVNSGRYKTQLRYGMFHPITVSYSGLMKVNGFTNRDTRFFPGHSIDSLFCKKLYDLDNKYSFIMSEKTFEYHLGSYSNKRLKKVNPEADARHNSELFNEIAGMTQQDFHKIIKYGEKVI